MTSGVYQTLPSDNKNLMKKYFENLVKVVLNNAYPNRGGGRDARSIVLTRLTATSLFKILN